MTSVAPRVERSRDVALAVVRDVFGSGARGAQAAFDYRAGKAHVDDRERAFAAELAYGAIKMRRRLDWHLAPFLGKRMATIPPTILEILRLGAYQLIFMHGVVTRAAVHESVSLARTYGHRGTAGLVNAVLRRLSETLAEPQRSEFESEIEYLATLHSFPTWIAQRLAARFPDIDTGTLLGAINEPPALALRVNLLVNDLEAAGAALAALGVQSQPSAFVRQTLLVDGLTASALERHAQGRWNVQSESSCMPVDVLDPQPGETVLDLCSGRAHKTLQIAERSGGVTVIGVEHDAKKIAAAMHALERSGASGVSFVQADAASLDAQFPAADAVLLDAPCSGSGILGRHPEARWRKRPDDASRLASEQERLLESAAQKTKAGGRLVYSVCSVEPEENEMLIERFLTRHPTFAPERCPERYARFARADAVLVPPGIERRDGFFIAALRRDA